MSPNTPQISVVIPHLNQPDSLELCLASLDCQALEPSSFEVIVVDNGSASPPREVIARHRARLLAEPTPGPGPARNLGIRNAAADIVAFIDADCRAHPAWLRVALQQLNLAPKATVLGGDVRIWHESERSFTAVEAYESVFAYLFKRYIEQHGYSGTGNLVMRRADFDRVGPFAGIGLAEDIDWGRRARAAGLTFKYVPEMIVFHPPRRSIGELCIKWDRHLRHYINMARGTPLWRLRWSLRALAILISPAADGFKVFTSDRVHGVPARLKALAVLVTIRSYRAWKMIVLLWSRNEVMWNCEVEVSLPDVE